MRSDPVDRTLLKKTVLDILRDNPKGLTLLQLVPVACERYGRAITTQVLGRFLLSLQEEGAVAGGMRGRDKAYQLPLHDQLSRSWEIDGVIELPVVVDDEAFWHSFTTWLERRGCKFHGGWKLIGPEETDQPNPNVADS